ncbi:hypothetical protein [Leptospira noguchii]|uniref:hypothetical protein n=1 Tax=Leptospira noguchii TaxID=28182 RepID=UPI003B8A64DF
MCNSFRILSQIFPSLSCSTFDTMDVYDPGSGLICCEIVRLDFRVLSFLLVSFSPAFTYFLDTFW